VIEHADVRLLSDPWFEGAAFSGNWGLRYIYPSALERAAACTHLWISHWHSDHLHEDTLSQLARRAPDIQVLANVSANFSMVDRLKSFGFRNIVPLEERKEMRLANDWSVTRFPTAGIDNMLVIRAGPFTSINYNDCNLPRRALQSILRKVGPVGLVLTNYNHAAKLLERRTDEAIKQDLTRELLEKVQIFRPRVVIPFASHHYYRSPYSTAQNSSMLQLKDIQEIVALDARILPLAVGDRVIFDAGWRTIVRPLTPPLLPSSLDQKAYTESVPWPELLEIARQYAARIRSDYLGVVRWTEPLRIEVADSDRYLVLDLASGVREGHRKEGEPHIVAHSSALKGWMARRFGEDSFFDGADFGIVASDVRPLRRMMLATMVDNKQLSPAYVLGLLKSKAGVNFLVNRREEIWATLVGRRLKAGEPRL
jgi:L-ascorbate metabolism protein UlaG (beta-lactamase superfamily)